MAQRCTEGGEEEPAFDGSVTAVLQKFVGCRGEIVEVVSGSERDISS